MTGIYFSGTGNTKHCVEEFIHCFDVKNQSYSIETPEIEKYLAKENIIVFGYPVYFSNAPKIVMDFIKNHKNIFVHKKVFIIVTMGLFSGDGAGCSARLLKKYGSEIIGGLHLHMPDCISDNTLLKKTLEQNQVLVRKADEKIYNAANNLKEGNPPRDGLSFLHHLAGLFGQRLWFYGESISYKNKPVIDSKKCTLCGLCIKNCPMKNLEAKEGQLVHQKKCTLCYRCVNNCPAEALTILGKNVYQQYSYEKYTNSIVKQITQRKEQL